MTIRVLVVDDHPVVRHGLRALIDAQPDMRVTGEAGDGEGAVAAVRERRPDVVVMDVTMPGLNGMEGTRRIQDESPEVRVLCLSVHADPVIVSEALAAGAAGYVLKDSAASEVVDAIRIVASRQAYLSPAVAGGVVRDYVSYLDTAHAGVSGLTPREQEVLQLIAEGHSTRDIAARLQISAKTVGTHREHLMEKLGLRSVVALTKYAIRRGIVTVEPDLE